MLDQEHIEIEKEELKPLADRLKNNIWIVRKRAY